MVVVLHALALFVFMSGNRIVRERVPQTIMLFLVPPKVVEPPPPPPPPPQPRRHKSEAPTRLREAAAPPLRDIEFVPRTEIVPTIVDNAFPIEVAGGKPEATGTAGTGDVGEGVGGGAPVKVGAVINPDNCERPRLPWSAEQRKLTGHVILAVLIDVDGKVTKARIARSSGEPVLDRTALAGASTCHFVAATVDKVPVPSWELFRFSWTNR
jgi:protein TonB